MKTIRAENLAKLYHLGDGGSSSIRDAIGNLFSRRSDAAQKDDLWALRDVSFEVAEGETLGIIGHNGAGKSTLLKILSRITKPTSGSVEITGRVGSLLEVGTGFHNELTGRENIYLNGAILGMKRAEITRRFDEIVEFSEVERFLDTPVKHYSSGMYMRLAFAVAAHLEPEVLIVDEVLAVGDINFQKKCLGKMSEVSSSGRTVLFVSHNLGSLGQVCTNGLLLENGRSVAYGGISETIELYLGRNSAERQIKADIATDSDMLISEAFLSNKRGEMTTEVPHDEAFNVEFTVDVRKPRRGAQFCIALLNKNKERVFTDHRLVEDLIDNSAKSAHLRFAIPGGLIAPNGYSFLVQIFLPDGEIVHELSGVCPFTVIDVGSELSAYKDYGYLQMRGKWDVIAKQ